MAKAGVLKVMFLGGCDTLAKARVSAVVSVSDTSDTPSVSSNPEEIKLLLLPLQWQFSLDSGVVSHFRPFALWLVFGRFVRVSSLSHSKLHFAACSWTLFNKQWPKWMVDQFGRKLSCT